MDLDDKETNKNIVKRDDQNGVRAGRERRRRSLFDNVLCSLVDRASDE